MSQRIPIALGAFATVVFATAACSTGGADTSSAASSSPKSAAQQCAPPGTVPATPTIEQLNALLARGLDPAVPAADKVDLIQGAQADPTLFDRIQPAIAQVALKVTFHDVTDDCRGHATANAVLTINGQDNPGQIPLVAEDRKWKLEKTWGCGLAGTLNVTSPICG